MRRRYNFTAVLSVLVFLAGTAPETASAFFCFSFGSKAHGRPPHGAYLLPYPGVVAPMYPAYGYSPVPPAYNYNNIYYPPPPSYVTPPPWVIRK